MYALAAQSAGTNWVVLILVYVVIFGGFYMLFMRPQKKEQKRIQEMIAEMEVGDTVLTTSGFYGVIIDITDDDLIVEFGNNKNCRIPMQKAAGGQKAGTKPGFQVDFPGVGQRRQSRYSGFVVPVLRVNQR